jgi:DHA2 family multidrug resistance protein-like MFS transporter
LIPHGLPSELAQTASHSIAEAMQIAQQPMIKA